MNALGRHLIALGLMELEPGWFEVFIEHFRVFVAEQGHGQVPKNHKSPDGYPLGQKVGNIRAGSNKTTEKQRTILDAEGFIWNVKDWWPKFIEHFRAFKQTYRHCEVQRDYACPDGYKLGRTVSNIRSDHYKLTKEQRAVLDAEGFVWNALEWFTSFMAHFRAFKAENGHVVIRRDHKCFDGYKLGQKVGSIRSRKNKLTEEQQAILNAEGFIWDANRIGAWWPEFIEHFRAFKTEHGHVEIHKNHKCSDGYPLGQKVNSIRCGANRPTDEQRATLDAEGFIWNASNKGAWWPEFIEYFRAYKAENGHCVVPIRHKCSDDYPLGRMVNGIRTGHNKLTEEQQAILNAEGFIWNASTTGVWWPEFIKHFLAFKAEHGHCRVAKDYKSPNDNYPLGMRASNIRTGRNKPTEEQRAVLDAEGFIWKTRK